MKTIRTHLVVLGLGTLLPMVLLAAILALFLVRQEQETFRRGATDRLRAVTSAVEAYLHGSIATLEALAASKNLQNGDMRSFHEEMVRVLATQPEWRTITLGVPAGDAVLNAIRPYGTQLPRLADPDDVKRVAEKLRPVISSIGVGTVTGRIGIAIRIPVVQNAKAAHVLTGVVDPALFAKLLAEQRVQPGWAVAIVDRNGKFIARWPPPPSEGDGMASENFRATVARAPEGWSRGTTLEGHDIYRVYMTSKVSDWTVSLAMPATEVEASGIRAAWAVGLGTLVCLAFGVGFAYLMGRRIARPIADLAMAARSLGEGTDLRLEDASISEVVDVSRALNGAAGAIQERQALVEREKEALKAADQAKDEFLAMLGHELRNPLGALTTSAEILRIAKPGDETARKAQGVIERQTRHMTRLVEDLLDISRLTMGKASLKRKDFDLYELAMRVVRTWQQTRNRPGGVRVGGSGVWVNADRSRIEQILTNLLDNASKFSASDKPIRVDVTRVAEEAVFTVEDQGEGMSAEMIDQVFGLFVQGPQGPDRARGGMGIGLALVKRLAQLHGGSVAAASPGLGHGTTLTVKLPAVPRPAELAESGQAEPRAGSRRVLLVEDNDDARSMLESMLVMEGHRVDAFSEGTAAIEHARDDPPEVALIDIGLPGIDGYEVARRLRFDNADRRMKLIAITGYGQADDERRAVAAGFDLHFTKPVPLDRLREIFAALAPKA